MNGPCYLCKLAKMCDLRPTPSAGCVEKARRKLTDGLLDWHKQHTSSLDSDVTTKPVYAKTDGAGGCPLCAKMLENAPPYGDPVLCRRHEGETIRVLRRLVEAIGVYEMASTVVILKPGDLGYDEYEEALLEARRLVNETSAISFAREQEGENNGVPWCHRCPDGECRGELKLNSCDIRTVVTLTTGKPVTK